MVSHKNTDKKSMSRNWRKNKRENLFDFEYAISIECIAQKRFPINYILYSLIYFYILSKYYCI